MYYVVVTAGTAGNIFLLYCIFGDDTFEYTWLLVKVLWFLNHNFYCLIKYIESFF